MNCGEKPVCGQLADDLSGTADGLKKEMLGFIFQKHTSYSSNGMITLDEIGNQI
jgi:hypothetical protein